MLLQFEVTLLVLDEFTQGIERDALFADRMRRDATLRNLELIGEAATRVPDAVRTLAPDVP